VPSLLFVIDVKREALAITEANKLGIPVIAVVDSNCAPEGVDYMIPGNDDAARAIQLYCDLAARSALDGMSAQLGAAGVDLGEMEEVVEEVLSSDIPAMAVEAEVGATEAEAEVVANEVETDVVAKEAETEVVAKESEKATK
jgi:small subunit ribosomal protein S2